MSRSTMFAIVMISVGFATESAAQIRRAILFGAAAGFSFVGGDGRDVLENGPHAQAMLEYVLPLFGFESGAPTRNALAISLRTDVAYDRFKIKQEFNTPGNLSTLSGTLNAVFRYGIGRLQPFASIGSGGYRLKTEAVLAGGAEEAVETRMGINLAGGFALPLRGVSPFFEIRYHSVFTNVDTGKYTAAVVGFMF